MKRQKRYTSRDPIQKDIASARRRMGRLFAHAAALDSEANLLRDAENASEKIKNLRNEADRLRAQAGRLESTRIPKLIQALQEMDTVPLILNGLEQRQVVLKPLVK